MRRGAGEKIEETLETVPLQVTHVQGRGGRLKTHAK